jgi:hypothetical protein
MPVVVCEDPLIDDVGAVAHRRFGSLRVFRPISTTVRGDIDDVPAVGPEALEPCAFVFGSLFSEKLRLGVAHSRRASFLCKLESEQMFTFEKVVQVAGREEQAITDSLHEGPPGERFSRAVTRP